MFLQHEHSSQQLIYVWNKFLIKNYSKIPRSWWAAKQEIIYLLGVSTEIDPHQTPGAFHTNTGPEYIIFLNKCFWFTGCKIRAWCSSTASRQHSLWHKYPTTTCCCRRFTKKARALGKKYIPLSQTEARPSTLSYIWCFVFNALFFLFANVWVLKITALLLC